MNYNTTKDYDCQVKRIFQKLEIKKRNNKKVISWLDEIGEDEKAEKIRQCGQHIGITDIDGIAKIIKADFCRERLCAVCAWRRQAKFVSQMNPVIDVMANRGYQFLFATLTVKNTRYEDLKKTVDIMMKGYDRLCKRRKIKRAWLGITRSLELTYNEKERTFHPHIHLLIAVDSSYFDDENKYITSKELSVMWAESVDVDYLPIVDIRKVDNTDRATVETLKYALKPTDATLAYKAFFYVLKGRRLISFCGVFQKIRNELKYSDFENILTDDVEKKGKKITYDLYTFDATGGVYTFTSKYEINL